MVNAKWTRPLTPTCVLLPHVGPPLLRGGCGRVVFVLKGAFCESDSEHAEGCRLTLADRTELVRQDVDGIVTLAADLWQLLRRSLQGVVLPSSLPPLIVFPNARCYTAYSLWP